MASFQPQMFGRYLLMEKLATGGMAEIYKAKTFGIDGFEKQLVIKRILPQWSGDEDFVKMLVDEAKLSVLLSHANIIQVYDLGRVGDDYFISMEYIQGVDLRRILTHLNKAQQKLPEALAVYILSEVCRGLEYAHSKRDKEGKSLHIVHRDINPPNILVSFEGEVKIGDFGIAKAAQNLSHTITGMLKGKIAYLSPEQTLGQPIDQRADIFSAGALLSELLMGVPLFKGETAFEILNKIRLTHIHENSFPGSIPLTLRKILAKALASSTKDRYRTASEMQIDLTHYLHLSHPDFTTHHLTEWMHEKFGEQLLSSSRPHPVFTGSSFLNEESVSLLEETDITSTEIEPLPPLKKKSPLVRWIASSLAVLSLVSFGVWGAWKMNWFQGPKTIWIPPPLPASPPSELVSEEPLTVEGPLTGVLQVQSEPSGAHVFLNDLDTGLFTPVTIQSLELEKGQKITVKKHQYQELAKIVTLLSPDPETVYFELEPTPYSKPEVRTPKAPAKEVAAKEPSENPVKRGFKKAGSSIKGFFTGDDDKKKEEDKKKKTP